MVPVKFWTTPGNTSNSHSNSSTPYPGRGAVSRFEPVSGEGEGEGAAVTYVVAYQGQSFVRMNKHVINGLLTPATKSGSSVNTLEVNMVAVTDRLE